MLSISGNFFLSILAAPLLLLSSTGLAGDKLLANAKQVSQDLVRMTGIQIKKNLKNKIIIPDRSLSPSAFEFSESFYADGRWLSSRQERAPVHIDGRWWVERNSLCVRSSFYGTQCRKVFKNSKNGMLATTDLRVTESDGIGSGLIFILLRSL